MTYYIRNQKKKSSNYLGDSTEEGPSDKRISYSTNEPEQGFSIDHAVLQINFDEQNKVKGVSKNHW